MNRDLGIDSTLLLTEKLISSQYLEKFLASLSEMVARGLDLDDVEESLIYLQKLYSSAMSGAFCGIGEQLGVKPFVVALYMMMNIVAKMSMQRSTYFGRLFSREKQLLFDAHKQLQRVSDKVLEQGKNWDSGIYGAFFTAAMQTSQLGELPFPPAR